jgi:DNA-binding IclR family transcriptional regulator
MAEPLNRSVDRACSLMSAFSLDEPRLTLADLARRVQLPKATVYRLASSLVDAGFMSQAADGRYGLGFKLLELGAVVRDNLDLVDACLGDMEQLAEQTGETVLLAQVDWPRREVVIVHRLDSAHSVSVLSQTGRRSSIPPGCLGKAALMGLPPAEADSVIGALELTAFTPNTTTDAASLRDEIAACRARGYASEENEFLPDVSGVAVPVLFEGGRPLGAIGVVGPSSRLHGTIDALGATVRDAVARRHGGNAGIA